MLSLRSDSFASCTLAPEPERFVASRESLLEAEDNIEIIGQVGDGDALLELLAVDPPEIVIIDVSMSGPGVEGICRHIEQAGWPTQVVVLTMHENPEMARQFPACGARAFVLKRNAFDELRAALDCVSGGKTYVSPHLAGELAAGRARGATPLSNREREVALLVAEGHTNARIARELAISVKTVQTHRAHTMEKLNVHSAAELVRRMAELGLLSR